MFLYIYILSIHYYISKIFLLLKLFNKAVFFIIYIFLFINDNFLYFCKLYQLYNKNIYSFLIYVF